MGLLALEDELQALLQSARRIEPLGRPIHVSGSVVLLPPDPVTEISVGQRLEQLAVELVVVNKRAEAVLLDAVPDMPDKWALLEELTMLLKVPVLQPPVDALAHCASFCKQLVPLLRRPPFAECGLEQRNKTVGGGCFTPHGG